jgi:signal peptidase I
MYKNVLNFILSIFTIAVISLAVIVPIRYFVVQPFYVNGASMEPSFYDQEYLLVDELSYKLREPARGDIIVFRYPKDPSEHFIKRIIGLPGEKVEFKNNKVYIYNEENPKGVALEETYLEKNTATLGLAYDLYELGEQEYFVMGDNREYSKDSRSFGPVNKGFFTGRVIFRGWPFYRMELLSHPEYPNLTK